MQQFHFLWAAHTINLCRLRALNMATWQQQGMGEKKRGDFRHHETEKKPNALLYKTGGSVVIK